MCCHNSNLEIRCAAQKVQGIPNCTPNVGWCMLAVLRLWNVNSGKILVADEMAMKPLKYSNLISYTYFFQAIKFVPFL